MKRIMLLYPVFRTWFNISLCDLYMRKMSIYFFLLLQTLIEGAMTGYTENGMKIAQDTLVMLNCL